MCLGVVHCIKTGMALKLEVGPGVLSFNPRLSFPAVATGDRKQFQCLHIVLNQLNNKTGLLFLEVN